MAALQCIFMQIYSFFLLGFLPHICLSIATPPPSAPSLLFFLFYFIFYPFSKDNVFRLIVIILFCVYCSTTKWQVGLQTRRQAYHCAIQFPAVEHQTLDAHTYGFFLSHWIFNSSLGRQLSGFDREKNEMRSSLSRCSVLAKGGSCESD